MGWSLRDSDPVEVAPWLNLQMSRIWGREGSRMLCSDSEQEIIIASFESIPDSVSSFALTELLFGKVFLELRQR